MEHRYSTSYLPGMNNENHNPYQSHHQPQQHDPRQHYDFAAMHTEPLATQSSNHTHPYSMGARGVEKSTLPPLQPPAPNANSSTTVNNNHNGNGNNNGQSNLPPIYASQPLRSAHGYSALGSAGGPDTQPSHQMYPPPPGSSGNMLPPTSSFAPVHMGYQTAMHANHQPGGPYQPGVQMRLPDFRPMQNGSNHSSSQNSPVTPFPPFNPMAPGQQHHSQPQPYIPGPDEPLHVVGSQGRRGILPSEPGRLAVDTQTPSKSMIPVKDADGKYPCQHCNKTYLHAKHLKRHLLRHTGDRPYSCFLCKDTFSRSDILKRHFQKCSIRRGNPTGASHLSHQRRNTNTSNRLSISTSNEPIGLASLPDVNGQAGYGKTGTGGSGSPTVSGDPTSSYASSVASMSARSSRANSLIQPPGARMPLDGRQSVGGIGLSHLNANTSGEQQQSQVAPQQSSQQPAPPTNMYGNGNVNPYIRPHSQSNPMGHHYGYASAGPGAPMIEGVKHESNGSQYSTSGTGTPSTLSTRGSSGSALDWNGLYAAETGDQNGGRPGLPTKSEYEIAAQHHQAQAEQQSDMMMGRLYGNGAAYGGENHD